MTWPKNCIQAWKASAGEACPRLHFRSGVPRPDHGKRKFLEACHSVRRRCDRRYLTCAVEARAEAANCRDQRIIRMPTRQALSESYKAHVRLSLVFAKEKGRMYGCRAAGVVSRARCLPSGKKNCFDMEKLPKIYQRFCAGRQAYAQHHHAWRWERIINKITSSWRQQWRTSWRTSCAWKTPGSTTTLTLGRGKSPAFRRGFRGEKTLERSEQRADRPWKATRNEQPGSMDTHLKVEAFSCGNGALIALSQGTS